MKTNKMVKKILSIALCLALVMSYVPMVGIDVSAAVADLTVTIDTSASVTLKDTDSDNYYEIGTADELYAFAAAVNGGNTAINGELTANITVNNNVLKTNGELNGDGSSFRVWTPIGTGVKRYAGVFDGASHTISGIYFNDSTVNRVGLFGLLYKGTVKNVGVTASYINGNDNVGGVVGQIFAGNVINCYNTGTVSGNACVGGVAGYITNSSDIASELTNCYNTGTVSGTDIVGGVVGDNGENGKVTNSYNSGSVSGKGGCIGGVIGQNNSTISNCYNIGSISGIGDNVGGVTGYNGSQGTVTNCYNTNIVSDGNRCVGGVVGFNRGKVTNSYNSGTVSGVDLVGGVVGSNTDGSVSGCYYLNTVWNGGIDSEDVTGSAEAKTAEEFAGGEIAYLLNGDQTSIVWYQTIGTNSYPVLDSNRKIVYRNGCLHNISYSNTKGTWEGYDNACDTDCNGCGDVRQITHNYENGICIVCSDYVPAVLNNGYYEISNAGQLMWFAKLVNGGEKSADAILMADIDMSGIDWTPICSTGLYYNTTTYTDKGYEGTFDGGGYTISNLKITGTDGVKASYGLFGTLSGTVKNLGMSGMTFSYADTYDTNTTDARAGAIAGQMLDGSLISDCFAVDSSLTPNNYIVGGIAGCNYAGTIQNCYTKNVTISAHDRCGNLVSDTRGDISTTDRPGTVKNCYTDASRIVGTNTSGSEYITGCVANILDSFFASGEITYKLNADRTETVWYQKDGMPAFSGSIVYENTCGGDIFYSTTDGDFDSHNIGTDLRCTNCGSYEPATLVTAENYSSLGLDESYVDYYAIKNASNLYWYSERERIGDISGSIVLLNDITLDNSKAEWVPIGWDGDCTFDGRGNTITLKLDYGTEQDSASYGLFGTCNYSIVKNLFLDGNIKVNTTGNVGAVAASMYRTTISGVISTANVTNTCTTVGNVGGLAGYFGGKHDTTNNQYSKIENSAVYADVTGYNAGGLVGQGWNGTQYWDITNAAYVGNVTTTNTTNGLAGAIVGYQATDTGTSTFTNIYWCENDSLGFYGKRDTENQAYTNTSAKTPEQFASGEVAYLLQSGNTTQVWGQDNNQTGATPILDSTGLYKVVTVGKTGNYSVANVGDTNSDGIVDVTDYQALVNKALSDNHEQIETASYDDIVKYDLDGDGYLDVIDASIMHLLINGFAIVEVYAVGDYDLNGKAFEEADLKAIRHAIENPGKLSTAEKYACDINADGKVSEEDLTELTAIYGEITGTTCADNVKVYYSWGNNYSTCTATAMCTLCSKKIATETVNTISETITKVTCTQDGKTKYTATFKNELFEAKVKTVTTDMLPHDLGEWTDNSDGTHIRGCKNCDYTESDKYTSATPAKSSDSSQGNYYGFALSPGNTNYMNTSVPANKTLQLDSLTLQTRTGSNSYGDMKIAVYEYTGDETTGTYLGVSSSVSYASNATLTFAFDGITVNSSSTYQFLFVDADTTADLSTFTGYQSAAMAWGISLTNSFASNIPSGWGTYKGNGINSWEGMYIPVTTITMSMG